MLRRIAALAVVAVICAAALSYAHADSQVRIVRLSYIDGRVQIDRNGGQGFETALMNMPITQDARLETGPSGRAEVEFENGSTVRLAPETKITFRELGLRSSGEKSSQIELESGTAYFEVRPKDHSDFRLLIGNQEIPLTRSVHFRATANPPDVKLAVFKGEIEFQAGPQALKIKKNETAELSSGHYDVAKGIAPDGFDTWDETREDYHDRYASNSYVNSPYRYGYSDLSYYGNYVNVPGYGNLWRPYNAGPGWDPFMDGAWAFYPGAGYVWISNYPWGWTPYRYGSWVYTPAYGWCWQPGRHWNRWAAVPIIRTAPRTFVAPQPPPVSTAGTVIVNRGRPAPAWNPKMPLDDGFRARPRPGTTVTSAPAPLPSPVAPPAPVAAPAATPKPAPVTRPHSGRNPDGDDVIHLRRERTVPAPAPQPKTAPPAPVAVPRATPALAPKPAPGIRSDGHGHERPNRHEGRRGAVAK
jgi:FecR protein